MAPLDQRIRDAIRRDKNGPTAQLLGDVIAEIERLQADAARYRWLRGDVPSHSLRWGRWEVRNWTGRYWDDTRKDGLDAAIDAAMKGE